MKNSLNIIMVHSYKGGSGKTAFSVNLAQYLSVKKNKRVLLIEQDTGGATFTNIFKVEPELYWNDFYKNNRLLKELIIHRDDFDIICSYEQETLIPEGEASKLFLARQVERIQREVKFLRSSYDFIILDTRPGFTLDLVTSIAISDIAVLMTRIDTDTISKTIDLFNKIYASFSEKILVLIQNQIPQKIEGYEDMEVDLDVIKSTSLWDEFAIDKNVINIPLKYEIAYPLSLSKLLPLNNEFYQYIAQFYDVVSQLLEKS